MKKNKGKKMRVFLCEKPSQGQAVANALGMKKREKGYYTDGNVAVVWGIGHLLSQANPEYYEPELARDKQGWSVPLLPIVPQTWKMELPDVKKDPGRYAQAMAVKMLLAKATEVVIATDNDREGDTIAWELMEFFGYKGTTLRIFYTSMDNVSLKKSVNDLRNGDHTYNSYLAGLGRMRADWLFGMNMTMALTSSNSKMIVQGDVLSAGRVQSPIVYLVVLRELEIKNFIPTVFYKFDADFVKNGTSSKYSGSLKIRPEFIDPETGYLIDPEKVKSLLNELRQTKDGVVSKYDTVQKNEKAPLGFSLSELQKEGSKRFGYSSKKTLDIAQSLYEKHKLTTYPRSDCFYASHEQFLESPQIMNSIKSNVGLNKEYESLFELTDLKRKSKMWDTAKITAHHAIIPTITRESISKISKDEANIYDLICKRYIMQFMPDYVSSNVSIETQVGQDVFLTYGNTTLDMGWKIADPKLNEANKSVPVLELNDKVDVVKVKERKEQTKPPSSYTEDKLMDDLINIRRFIENEKLKKIIHKAGIGTEATRGAHLENVEKKGYLKRNGKNILPTDKAFALMEVLPDTLKKPETTAYWEEELNQVVLGTRTLDQFMAKVKDVMGRMVNQVKDGKCQLKAPVSGANGKIYTCDICSGVVKKIKTKVSKKTMWVCGECSVFYEDEVGRRGKLIKFVQQPKGDFPCKVCNKSQMIRKKNRDKEEYFWVCSDKKCETFAQDNEGKLGEFNKPRVAKVKETSEHACPKCKDGSMISKVSAKGVAWWGCNNYPKCKETAFDDNGKPKVNSKK